MIVEKQNTILFADGEDPIFSNNLEIFKNILIHFTLSDSAAECPVMAQADQWIPTFESLISTVKSKRLFVCRTKSTTDKTFNTVALTKINMRGSNSTSNTVSGRLRFSDTNRA